MKVKDLLEGKKKISESVAAFIPKADAKDMFKHITGNGFGTAKREQELDAILYDMLQDEMPYGTRKARDGDPANWIADYFSEMSDDEVQDWIEENSK